MDVATIVEGRDYARFAAEHGRTGGLSGQTLSRPAGAPGGKL